MNYKEYLLKNKKLVTIGASSVGIVLIVSIAVYRLNGHENIVSPRSDSRSDSYQNAYSGNNSNAQKGQPTKSAGLAGDGGDDGALQEYDYKDASDHIGERATVKGSVIKVFTAKSGVTFFDFCSDFDSCPFSAVIFASDLPDFGDVQKYVRSVKMTGTIKSYSGRAEMVLNSPDQIK